MARHTKPIRPATRTLQTLRGTGKVYAGNEFLCEARYSVAVHQGIVYAGSQPSAGVTDIQGTLVLVDSELNWKTGMKLSLQMEDGRTAAFITTTGKTAAGVYGILVNVLSDRHS